MRVEWRFKVLKFWRITLWSVKLDLQIRAAHSHQENPREVHRGPLTTLNGRITIVIFCEIQQSSNQPQTKVHARPYDDARLKCIMQRNCTFSIVSASAFVQKWMTYSVIYQTWEWINMISKMILLSVAQILHQQFFFSTLSNPATSAGILLWEMNSKSLPSLELTCRQNTTDPICRTLVTLIHNGVAQQPGTLWMGWVVATASLQSLNV